MKNEYTIEKRTEKSTIYTFTEPNDKGEKVVVDITECENPGGKRSLPYLWKKHGYIDRVLDNYLHVMVYVYDTEGRCWGRYNPQEKVYIRKDNKGKIVENRPVIDFNWMFEATEENKKKILDEVYRRATT